MIKNCSVGPKQVMDVVRKQFAQIAPPELVQFTNQKLSNGPIGMDDTLFVKIRMAGEVKVRVAHVSDNSVTLATSKGHPEAGRITFGAYRNDREDVVFHIRSRAKSSSRLHVAGFLILGDAMQTTTWTDFIDRLSHMVGDGVVGSIHAEKCVVEPGPADAACDEPTFIAWGD